jgi:hypothetical protein
MTGSVPSARRPPGSSTVETIRCTAQCRSCGEVLPGEMTIERHPWEPDSDHRRSHFCDTCLERLHGSPEKPLEAVIQEQFGD